MANRELIVIAGPTAVGKTSVAIRLARHFSTEIVSADSRQVFREMEIGTARPSPAELQEIPHHFIASRSIHEEYDAGTYGREALACIHRLFDKHERVILVGGSGLYIKAVCEGFDEMPEIPAGLREEIMSAYREKGLGWLQEQVGKSDPDYFAVVDQKNPQRLVRALELHRATGKTVGILRKRKSIEHPFAIRKIGLMLERDVLYHRIDERMDAMIAAGLLEEAQRLFPFRHLPALQTVGYQEVFGYLEGRYDRAEAIRLLKKNSRNYAKRQMTWFKKDRDVVWLNPANLDRIFDGINPTGFVKPA